MNNPKTEARAGADNGDSLPLLVGRLKCFRDNIDDFELETISAGISDAVEMIEKMKGAIEHFECGQRWASSAWKAQPHIAGILSFASNAETTDR